MPHFLFCLSQTEGEPDLNLKVLIFNSEADSAIANRLLERLRDVDCQAERYDFLPSGEPKIALLQEFILANDALIWIATATSIKDDGMMKTIRHIGQYAAVGRGKGLQIQFITYQPREYINLELPLTLDAYSTLKEDDCFNDRLAATLKRIKKKKCDHAKKLQLNNSSSAASAVISRQFQNVDVQISARSTDQDQIVEYSKQVQASLCAQPGVFDCTTDASQASTPESLDRREDNRPAPTHNTFIIRNSNVTVCYCCLSVCFVTSYITCLFFRLILLRAATITLKRFSRREMGLRMITRQHLR